jgi:hypothetical protein
VCLGRDDRPRLRRAWWWSLASRVEGLRVLRGRLGTGTVRQLRVSSPAAGMASMVEMRFGSEPGMGLVGFVRGQSVRGRPLRR